MALRFARFFGFEVRLYLSISVAVHSVVGCPIFSRRAAAVTDGSI